jgi:putative PIG3 family NAD(P)H quinone oxidoreductase
VKAIRVSGEKLAWVEAEVGDVGAGEVKISNRASALNRTDLMQRAGGYQVPEGASEILGLECAGIVEAVGEGVRRVRPGDEVCALLDGGGYAETVVAPAGQVLKIPTGLSFVQAAALPEGFATAYLNLFIEAGLGITEKVLLHAGASGVGTAAIQLCNAFGSPCFVTCGMEDKIHRCIDLGAQAGCNRHDERFVNKVGEWTGGEGFNVILDHVGAAYLADNLRSLKLEGRLVIIGLMGGDQAEISLGAMVTKRLRIIGSTLRSRTIAEKAAVMDALKEYVWPRIERGEIKPVIDTVFPMDQADEAHQLLGSNKTFGKVVLEVV